MRSSSIDWSSHAIRIASSGVGAIIGGPIGGAIGGWLGGSLGPSISEVIRRAAELYGEGAGVRLFDIGTDSLIELHTDAVELEDVYSEALRLSLEDVRSRLSSSGFDDWFTNWRRALSRGVPVELSGFEARDFVKSGPESSFCRMMELLDAFGAKKEKCPPTLTPKCRHMPDALFAEFKARLPKTLISHFESLVTSPKFDQAWRQRCLLVERSFGLKLDRIAETTQEIKLTTDLLPSIADDVRNVRKLVERFLGEALDEGRVSMQQFDDKDAEIARLTDQLTQLRDELALRDSETDETRLSILIAAGDLCGAIELKSQQVACHRSAAEMLPQDHFELGTLYDLRFDWPNALESYREAWRLGRNSKFGFSYGYSALKQNQFTEAIEVYEALLKSSPTLPDRAMALHNLVILYSKTHRTKDAVKAHQKALSIHRELARTNREVYLPRLAAGLNNWVNVYGIRKKMKKAENACREALSIRQELARANPAAYRHEVAETLSNLAIIYAYTRRKKEAEEAYLEALAIQRDLAAVNPEAHCIGVASTLFNLANLYVNTKRKNEAERAYLGALAIQRDLAKVNPGAHCPRVALILHSLAVLYSDTDRKKEAQELGRESLSIYRQLAQVNPEAYREDVARALNLLVILDMPPALRSTLIALGVGVAVMWSLVFLNKLEPRFRETSFIFTVCVFALLLIWSALFFRSISAARRRNLR
jgi:tetratricopeptide (TPR) repeat protein